MPFIAERFDQRIEEKLRDLVAHHERIEEEPLLLAICYEPERDGLGPDSKDIFLFEVMENFGSNLVDPDRNIFEMEMGSNWHMQLTAGEKLHLVLTNPVELDVALEQRWSLAQEIQRAIARGAYEVLFSNAQGEHLFRKLQPHEDAA